MIRLRFPTRKPVVLVVGTFRSGTNLMKHLLETHFQVDAVFSKWFWKHGFPPTAIQKPLPAHVPVITVSKDPVALNASLYAFWGKTRPELDRGNSLSDFIRKPFIIYDNTDGKQRPHYLFATPTDYWNQYHFAWTHWPAIADRQSFVQIEALQSDPARVLDPLGARLGLRRRTTGPIILPEQPVRPSQDKGRTILASFPKSDVPQTNRELLSPDDISMIRQLVNPEIAQALGYLV